MHYSAAPLLSSKTSCVTHCSTTDYLFLYPHENVHVLISQLAVRQMQEMAPLQVFASLVVQLW